MHYSIFVTLIGLVSAAVAAPHPEAEPEMMRRADEAQNNAQTAQDGQADQNSQNAEWWGPGWGGGRGGGGWRGGWGGGGWRGGYGGGGYGGGWH